MAIGAIGVVAAGNLTTAAVNNDYKKLEEGLEKVEILLAVHPSQTLSEAGTLAGQVAKYHLKK